MNTVFENPVPNIPNHWRDRPLSAFTFILHREKPPIFSSVIISQYSRSEFNFKIGSLGPHSTFFASKRINNSFFTLSFPIDSAVLPIIIGEYGKYTARFKIVQIAALRVIKKWLSSTLPVLLQLLNDVLGSLLKLTFKSPDKSTVAMSLFLQIA